MTSVSQHMERHIARALLSLLDDVEPSALQTNKMCGAKSKYKLHIRTICQIG